MTTILKPTILKILRLFYENRNMPLHLREISRRVKMNESSISRHLNELVKNQVLSVTFEANLRKFKIKENKISEIFPIFDSEKLESLPRLRRDAIKLYIKKLEKKPLFLVVFGSTSKGTFRSDSDLDILKISYFADKDEKIKDYIEAQTGVKIQVFTLTEKQFEEELKLKKDSVVQSALETGFPVFNAKHFYEVIYE